MGTLDAPSRSASFPGRASGFFRVADDAGSRGRPSPGLPPALASERQSRLNWETRRNRVAMARSDMSILSIIAFSQRHRESTAKPILQTFLGEPSGKNLQFLVEIEHRSCLCDSTLHG